MLCCLFLWCEEERGDRRCIAMFRYGLRKSITPHVADSWLSHASSVRIVVSTRPVELLLYAVRLLAPVTIIILIRIDANGVDESRQRRLLVQEALLPVARLVGEADDWLSQAILGRRHRV